MRFRVSRLCHIRSVHNISLRAKPKTRGNRTVPLPVLNLDSPADRRSVAALIDRLRDQVTAGGDIADKVATIVDDVRVNGDDALVKYMRQWTNPAFTADMIRVSESQLA